MTVGKDLKAFAVLCALMIAGSANAAEVIFSDGDFDAWMSQAIEGPALGQTSAVALNDGNPGQYLSILTDTSELTRTGHFNPAFVYDPAGGEINSISGSLDFRNFNSFGQGHALSRILLQQDGVFFKSEDLTTGTTLGTWQSPAPTQFTLGDFSPVVGNGALDFSTAGAPIGVGFFTENNGGQSINVGYDNFLAVLDVNPVVVPLPMSAWLLVSAIAALGYLRRATPSAA